MYKIKVNIDNLNEISRELQRKNGNLLEIRNRASNAINSLDWEVKNRADIEGRVSRANSLASNLANDLLSMSSFVKNAANIFSETDRNKASSIGKISAKFAKDFKFSIKNFLNRLAPLLKFSLLGSIFTIPLIVSLPFIKKLIGVKNVKVEDLSNTTKLSGFAKIMQDDIDKKTELSGFAKIMQDDKNNKTKVSGSGVIRERLIKFNQKDYPKKILGDNNPITDSQYTIATHGCYITSLAMIYNYHVPGYTNPEALNDEILKGGGFVEGSGYKNAGYYAQPLGSPPRDGKISEIENQLASGNPVLAKITAPEDFHWVVIIGKNENGYIVINPIGGKEETLNTEILKVRFYEYNPT